MALGTLCTELTRRVLDGILATDAQVEVATRGHGVEYCVSGQSCSALLRGLHQFEQIWTVKEPEVDCFLIELLYSCLDCLVDCVVAGNAQLNRHL